MEEQLLYSTIFQQLKSANNALLAIHQNPDGDALGSALAFSEYFSRLNLPHAIFCKHEAPKSFRFLPGIEKISTDQSIFKTGPFDLLMVLDSGDLLYAGIKELLSQLSPRPAIIKIDHHPGGEEFGDINLIETNASSTTDIIFRIFEHNRVKITKEISTCLLCGIVTDTGGFSNLATTPAALNNAAELLLSGARAKQIITNTLSNHSIPRLKLWGKALSRLSKNAESKFVTTVITLNDLKECGANEKEVEGIANFLNSLDDANVILVLHEKEDGTIKGSLRTTHPNIDVSQLAKALGGGGHKKAAGFTIPGRIKETEKGWRIV